MTDWTTQPPSTPPTATDGPIVPTAPTAITDRPAPPTGSGPSESAPRSSNRRRTIIGVVLALVAGLSAVAGVASLWTTDEILSAATWESTSRAIVNDPTVQREVSASIAQQIVDGVGLEALVAGALPGALSGLSGTLTDKATELLTEATAAVVRTQVFADLWERAVAATHDQFVHAIDGSGGMTTITSRGLELSLSGVVAEVQDQLAQRNIGVLDSIDTSGLNVTFLLVDAPGLEHLRSWVRVLRVLDIVLPAIAVVAGIAGLLIARRRSYAVAALGVGGLLGAGVVAIVEAIGSERMADQISGGVIGGATATVVVDHITAGLDGALLVSSAVALIVLVIGIMGVIVGTPRRRSSSDTGTVSAA